MAKNIYIVRTADAWHEPDVTEVIGVFSSLKKAQDALPGNWMPLDASLRSDFEYHDADHIHFVQGDSDPFEDGSFDVSIVAAVIDVYELDQIYSPREE